MAILPPFMPLDAKQNRHRKVAQTVAKYLNASTSEIFFTGSGTEASNMIIKRVVPNCGVTRIISSRLEHHCVLHSVETMANEGLKVDYVNIDLAGRIDYTHLETLLQNGSGKTLVSLMHANNEIGTLLDLARVSELCKQYNALFHSDTVQTIGYYLLMFKKIRFIF